MTFWGLIAVITMPMARPAQAAVFLTVDEALKLAFPDCAVKRMTIYLNHDQLARAAALANGTATSALVNPYVAMRRGEVVGVAYFDVHVVRTQPETMMIVVDRESRVRRIEMIAFNEPREYLPRPAWLQQFTGQQLDDTLMLKRKIHNMTGATLTARAATDAVRRVLALHLVLKDTLIP